MEGKLEENQDLALVMAWPDQTARGDERWMAILKQLGVVKNLNFKVGHAAMVLVHRKTGSLAYFDFGRYITPRGYGRARSVESDPRLALETRAQIDNKSRITNLETILDELHQIEAATHGGGRLFFSVAQGLSYEAAHRFATRIVEQGPVKYGAIAIGNNSCSRYVAQVLLAGLVNEQAARRRITLPESIKPSPMSNVVNASPDRTIYCYHEGELETIRMSRWRSLGFQVDQLLHNFSTGKSKGLPCDNKPGNIAEPKRPKTLPATAQWLGGIGEGAWFTLERAVDNNTFVVAKYAANGHEEYRVACSGNHPINPDMPYQFTYHCHHKHHMVTQYGKEIVLETIEKPNKQAKTA
ncbi:DUF6695 family protein [Parapedobacter flavus]|uniref:DUF6695 family protein n=1 Tax=Parapedobacter flavus TaxID=3110225 RepID=UPI002DBA364E|nr:DUF6695 family protein [Parapedobacter sp. 10938]MEC3879039.1 DUF6695 family protein [Parapedobacter sp. 10938]